MKEDKEVRKNSEKSFQSAEHAGVGMWSSGDRQH